jgi:FKBP-type peptidyl-prolyl cis-trans isomerase FklB
MKLNRAVVVALCLIMGIACVWVLQTQTSQASAASTETTAAPEAAPAPPKMEFKNDQEKLSYAIGCRIGDSLKARLTAPSLSMFFVGLKQVLDGQPTDQEKLSYAMGCDIGETLKKQDVPVDLPMLTRAVTQVINQQPPAMTDEQIRDALMAWQKDVRAKADKKRQEEADKNLAEGKAFLEANAAKEGVKVLPSGLQYKVIKEGTGETPTATDRVKVNYKGTLINGTEFDSSYKHGQPATFPVNGVIKGWSEALQLMKQGSKWELYIPPNLAYGEGGNASIPPNSVLIFEVELLEVIKAPAGAATKPTVIRPKVTPTPTP